MKTLLFIMLILPLSAYAQSCPPPMETTPPYREIQSDTALVTCDNYGRRVYEAHISRGLLMAEVNYSYQANGIIRRSETWMCRASASMKKEQ